MSESSGRAVLIVAVAFILVGGSMVVLRGAQSLGGVDLGAEGNATLPGLESYTSTVFSAFRWVVLVLVAVFLFSVLRALGRLAR